METECLHRERDIVSHRHAGWRKKRPYICIQAEWKLYACTQTYRDIDRVESESAVETEKTVYLHSDIARRPYASIQTGWRPYACIQAAWKLYTCMHSGKMKTVYLYLHSTEIELETAIAALRQGGHSMHAGT